MSVEKENFDNLAISPEEVKKLVMDYYNPNRHEANTLTESGLTLEKLDEMLDPEFLNATKNFLNTLDTCNQEKLDQYLQLFRQKHQIIKNAIANMFLQEIMIELPDENTDEGTRKKFKYNIIQNLLNRSHEN